MLFIELAQTFEKMEKTRSRIELTNYLVELFAATPAEIIDKVVYLIQGKLGPDQESSELGIADKIVIKVLSQSGHIPINKIITEYNSIGDLGEVAFKFLTERTQATLFYEPLTVGKVFSTLLKISRTSGIGSLDVKIRLVNSLLSNSSKLESKFLVKLILGNLRLGIANFTLLDALTLAFTEDKKNRRILEQAFNVSSDLGKIATALANGSLSEVQSISISLFTPVRPMLAERAVDSLEALKKLEGSGLAEYKIDGERIQIHKQHGKIELFTRSLENVSLNFPDMINIIRLLPSKEMIVEGEIVAINSDSLKYLPFQNLMRRRRKYKIQEAVEAFPVMLNLFDLLFINGKDTTNLPFLERRRLLNLSLKGNRNNRIKLIEQTRVSSTKDIDAFMTKALENGCEGLMLKNPQSTYRAGARGWAWIKLKKEYSGNVIDSMDLVVLGALHGKGRRVGKYGALLLGTYDKTNDTFYTIGKVGTGFTDEILSALSDRLSKLVIQEKSSRVEPGSLTMDVWFEPKVVLEIISPEITLSPVYTAARNGVRTGNGLALRFPKFSGKIREDKLPEDATTVDEVLELYQNQFKQKSN
jgi:DNA ligase-1